MFLSARRVPEWSLLKLVHAYRKIIFLTISNRGGTFPFLRSANGRQSENVGNLLHNRHQSYWWLIALKKKKKKLILRVRTTYITFHKKNDYYYSNSYSGDGQTSYKICTLKISLHTRIKIFTYLILVEHITSARAHIAYYYNLLPIIVFKCVKI